MERSKRPRPKAGQEGTAGGRVAKTVAHIQRVQAQQSALVSELKIFDSLYG